MKKVLILMLTLAMLTSAAFAEGLTSFTAQDVSQGYDNPATVTQDIFAPYDITMVNVWATWCGYCVKEMPELARLKDMLPENVNMISICDDATSEVELAYQILETTGATNFPTLIPSEEMYSQLLGYVYSFPTTYFVDSEGVAVGYITGVPSMENAADAYLEIIGKALEMVENRV